MGARGIVGKKLGFAYNPPRAHLPQASSIIILVKSS